MYMENPVATTSLVCETQIDAKSIYQSFHHCKPATEFTREGHIYIRTLAGGDLGG